MSSRILLLTSILLGLGLGAWGLLARSEGALNPGVSEPGGGASQSARAPSGSADGGPGDLPVEEGVRREESNPAALGARYPLMGSAGAQPRGSGKTLTVRVLDDATGLPVKGVRISPVATLKGWLGFSEALGSDPATTDDAGEASVAPAPASLPGDPWKRGLLVLQGDGYATTVRQQPRVGIEQPVMGQREHLTCYIKRSGELRGRVTFAKALSGRVQKVRLRRRFERWPSGAWFNGDIFGDGRIGPDGQFTVKDVPPGMPFRVEILSVGEVVWTLPDFISLRSGEVRTVDWEVAPVTVRVHGIEKDFRAPRRLRVWLEPAPLDGSQVGEEWIDANPQARHLGWADTLGVATFDEVLPGRWRAIVMDEGDQRGFPSAVPLADRPAPSFVDFTVEQGSRSVDVDLPVHRGSYIVGTLHGEEGMDLSEAKLCAVANGIVHAETAYRGRSSDSFRIGPLEPGAYELRAMPGRWLHPCVDPPVSAEAGGEPASVHLRPGGELEVTAVDAATGKAVRGELFVDDSSVVVEGGGGFGSVRLKGLNGEALVLHVRAQDGRAAVVQHAGVAAGEARASLTVKLREPATLRLGVAADGLWRHFVVRRYGMKLAATWVAPGATGQLRVAPGVVELHEFTAGPDQPRKELGQRTVKLKPGSTLQIR